MSQYLKRLAYKVGAVFTGSLLATALAAQPFNVTTFNWGTSLTIAGSLSVLALLEGAAGYFRGDPAQPTLMK